MFGKPALRSTGGNGPVIGGRITISFYGHIDGTYIGCDFRPAYIDPSCILSGTFEDCDFSGKNIQPCQKRGEFVKCKLW